MNLTLAIMRIVCPMGSENEILACRAVSMLEPFLWQLQSALSTLQDDNEDDELELRLPGVLSGVRSVAPNIASDLVNIWGSVQKCVSSYLRMLPLPLPPPRTPMTPPRRMSRDNDESKTPSPVPLLLGDAASSSSSSTSTSFNSRTHTESRTTTITFRSRNTRGGRVSPRTLWSPLLRVATNTTNQTAAPKITEVLDEDEESPSSNTSSLTLPQPQISSLVTQKRAVRMYGVALFGMLRLGVQPTEFVHDSKLMIMLTSFLPRVSGNSSGTSLSLYLSFFLSLFNSPTHTPTQVRKDAHGTH